LTVNGASCWFLLYLCITMHGQQNIKYHRQLYLKNCALWNYVIRVSIVDIKRLPKLD